MIKITLLSIMLASSPSKNRKEWLPVVKAAADHYNIDWHLLDALIKQESNWTFGLTSPKGAQGLAQIMPATAKELGINDSFDPGQNIWGAAWYLKRMYQRFEDWELALAAYNAGPKRVGRCMCIPNISETVNYVVKIMERYNERKMQQVNGNVL